jgi:ribonuclease E
MLINVADDDEYRIAVVEDGVLEELYLERTKVERHVGDIYLGRVQNVEPSIQAAFIEIGTDRNAFLHVSDIRPDVHDIPPRETPESRTRRNNGDRNIKGMLKKGDQVLVQVTRESIDAKGPNVTTYVSLPGKYLVMMPGLSHHGVSRKISDESSRKRLKAILNEIDLPKQAGFIIRTAGLGRTKRDLQRDLNYLCRLWDALCKKLLTAKIPAMVYQESDLIIRCIRDLFTSDTDEVIIDSDKVCEQVRDFLSIVSPTYTRRVKRYHGNVPILTKFKVEASVDQLYDRKVPLPSGGSIVIDQTEALVAIDVNSGRYTEEKDAEMTAYYTNMEAAVEIARQLRLRDLGGVVVIDFIDMLQDKHRRDVERTLQEMMKRDRARRKILRTSQFGLVQMTRQRMRPSVARAVFKTCPMCGGTGHVRTLESVTLAAMRRIRNAIARQDLQIVECTMHPDAALHLMNEKRDEILDLEKQFNRQIRVISDASVNSQAFDVHGVRGKKTITLN